MSIVLGRKGSAQPEIAVAVIAEAAVDADFDSSSCSRGGLVV